MDIKALRRRCEQHLRDLALPHEEMTIEGMAAHVAARRGRPMHLEPFGMGSSGLSGAWVPGDQADHVFYEADTSRRHQVQIIAHELGHMVCGHAPALHGPVSGVALLAPGAAQHMLARNAYTDDQEREAEHMADLLVAYLDSSADPPPADPVTAALQHRPAG